MGLWENLEEASGIVLVVGIFLLITVLMVTALIVVAIVVFKTTRVLWRHFHNHGRAPIPPLRTR